MKKNILKLKLIVLTILVSAFSINAQSNDEDIYIGYSHIGAGNTDDNNTEIAFSKMEVKFNFYKKQTQKGAFYFQTLSYAHSDIDYSKKLNIPTELEQFHGFSYSVGASLPLKNNWRVTGVFSPTLSSNFEGSVSFNDLQFLGIVFLGKMINEEKKLYLNVGMMYSNSLGSPTPLPYFSFLWNKNKKIFYEIGFPNTSVKYKFSDKFSVGSRVFLSGDNLRLGDNLVFNDEKTSIDNLRLTNFGLGLNTETKIGQHISVVLAGGYTFARKFEFNNGNDVIEDFALDNNVFINLGFKIAY